MQKQDTNPDKNNSLNLEQANQDTPTKEGKKSTSEVTKGKSSTAQDFFKSRPSVTELFETSDGFLFSDSYLANQHVKALKNKAVKTIKSNK